MANGVFHTAKGKVNEYVARVDGNDPANSALIVVLLRTVNDTDAALEDRATLSAVLGANSEANFTNYARITVTDTGVTAPAPDTTNNWQTADITTDPVWSSAGGAANNTLVKLLVCYDSDTTAGDDTNIVPLTHHDVSATTNGGDLTAVLDSVGFYKAS